MLLIHLRRCVFQAMGLLAFVEADLNYLLSQISNFDVFD